MVEVNAHRLESLASGRAPIFEDHLEEALAGSRNRLTFTASHAEALTDAEVAIIAVWTLQGPSGALDLAYRDRAAQQGRDQLRAGRAGRGPSPEEPRSRWRSTRIGQEAENCIREGTCASRYTPSSCARAGPCMTASTRNASSRVGRSRRWTSCAASTDQPRSDRYCIYPT